MFSFFKSPFFCIMKRLQRGVKQTSGDSVLVSEWSHVAGEIRSFVNVPLSDLRPEVFTNALESYYAGNLSGLDGEAGQTWLESVILWN